MARNKKGRLVNGILLLDKPSGISSNAALQKVKRLYQAQKAGHTGSLDPLATGVLPVCLGEATKVSHFLLDADKRYRAKCILGAVTTTGDSEGDILEQFSIPDINKDELLAVLASFEGAQNQTPPMYSALKHNGRPLYEYARKGIEIERKSRPITLFEVKLINFSIHPADSQAQSFIEIEVHCSKGTYIRTLCEDIGKKLGCGAYISQLRRLKSGPFLLSQSITIDELYEQFNSSEVQLKSAQQPLSVEQVEKVDALLLPADTAIQEFSRIDLDELQYQQIQNGINIEVKSEYTAIVEKQNSEQYFRLYFNNKLVALSIWLAPNFFKPKRLLFL